MKTSFSTLENQKSNTKLTLYIIHALTTIINISRKLTQTTFFFLFNDTSISEKYGSSGKFSSIMMKMCEICLAENSSFSTFPSFSFQKMNFFLLVYFFTKTYAPLIHFVVSINLRHITPCNCVVFTKYTMQSTYSFKNYHNMSSGSGGTYNIIERK